MRIRLLKFGGTSVADAERRNAAARRVQEAIAEGVAPVVVVSALGRRGEPYATDTLLELMRDANPHMPSRETALLVGCGEIVSSVVFSGVLLRAGVRALALTGPQAGICTDDRYQDASIRSIEPDPLITHVCAGRVPVVAGFQGATGGGEIALLDRGGSDVSATALGYALGAERIDIFTDVQGILTADPWVVPDAAPIEALTYEQALLMARHGAKVLHPEAVTWAMRGPVPIHVRSTFEGTWCTRIGPGTQSGEALVGVTCKRGDDQGDATISVVGVIADRAASVVAQVAATLRAARIVHRELCSQVGVVTVTVRADDMIAAARALHAGLLVRPVELSVRSSTAVSAWVGRAANELETHDGPWQIAPACK